MGKLEGKIALITCVKGGIGFATAKQWTVQFFFNETKPLQQVSSFRLGDSRCENPLVDVEKRPPYLPQDQRYGPYPCLDIPPQTALSPDIAFAPSTLFVSPESFVSSH